MKLKFIYEISNFGPKLSRLLPLTHAMTFTLTAGTEWSRAKTEFMTLLQCEGKWCKTDKMVKMLKKKPQDNTIQYLTHDGKLINPVEFHEDREIMILSLYRKRHKLDNAELKK